MLSLAGISYHNVACSALNLGPGHDHYKRAYGLNTVTIGEGAATASTIGGRMAMSMESVWSLAGVLAMACASGASAAEKSIWGPTPNYPAGNHGVSNLPSKARPLIADWMADHLSGAEGAG